MASEQLKAVLKMLAGMVDLNTTSVEEMRSGMEAGLGAFPLPDDVSAQVEGGWPVPVEWISTPGCDDSRVLLYLHGGGYAVGSINTHRELVSRLARACGCRALLIDYRLGPEHRFPAALDDALACYSQLLDQSIAPGRIAIAGDSAGGGLTLATLLAAREAGLPMPAAAVGLSAWTDLSVSGDSITSRQEADPMLTGDQLRQFATWYLGEDGDPRNPLASPVFASLAGLPPLLLQVGSEEVLLDDTLRLADNARAAGVEVCVEQWDEMFHVWQALAAMLDEGQKAIDRIGEFLREKMG